MMGAKLVRDRIGDIEWVDGDSKRYLRPVKDSAEHDRLLTQKLLEEVGEFLATPTRNEAADVLEAMLAILRRKHGFPVTGTDICICALRKNRERGGFDGGLVWEPSA